MQATAILPRVRPGLDLARLKPVRAGIAVAATFLLAQVGGTMTALAYQGHQAAAADTASRQAESDFNHQVLQSIEEGTPKELVDPIAAEEVKLAGAPLPPSMFFIDRVRLDAVEKRASDLQGLTKRVRAVEVQSEVDVHKQMTDALQQLRADLEPARGAGVDVTAFGKFAQDFEVQHAALIIPKVGRDLVAAVQAKDKELRDATSAQVAATEAFQTAQADAQDALRTALGYLASAQAIPVLKVQDSAAAIAALKNKLAAAFTTADYQNVAAGLWNQAGIVQRMLTMRQEAYGLRDIARAHMQRAQQAQIDVGSAPQDLDAASAKLDQAGDMAALTASRDQIKAIKNAVDVKYNLAVYGPGKVIVVSTSMEELEAMQDGVVLLDTIVTTGRPSLPTVIGNFSVTNKYSPYRMVSPWPEGNPYYYPPTWMSWAMLFHDGGYFIHDAPWRTHFGPGSDTENGGTHGCVNVPGQPMSWLYGWTEIGTKVDTLTGGF